MAGNVTKLRTLLAELFMFEFAELDFGIYRIMNSKRTEIQRFLDQDLLPQVQSELGKVGSGERVEIQKDIDKAVANATSAGFNPDDSPIVKALRERLAAADDPVALEDEVFSLLAAFFRRYYKDGDYLALRRYKKDVYALPYEGEEVKLHWANADQYYIKSSEYFRDYVFKLPDGRRVHFKLTEADSEQNNNKAASGKERRFVLLEHEPLAEEDGELLIRFIYRIDPEKQATLNKAAAAQILELVGSGFAYWLEGLQTKAPTEKDAGRTLLEKHLGDYSARNSFDYFIHKDLGGFLRRELDFFIKSEVMLLDDIEEDTAPRVEQYLAKVRAVRRIARKIIDMLAQLEEFQKRLWLKKKFVVETNYCVTLDRVSEELYAEIAANADQREEWVRLFAIDQITGDLLKPDYSALLTVEFLKANPFLVLDTRFFPASFKARLLASFDDLDAQLNGLLVHSENFQALNLLQERYRGQVKCIYIDPPYNTGSDGFVYKDNYQHASWMSLMRDRLALANVLLNSSALGAVHLNDIELWRLRGILDSALGSDAYLVTVTTKASTVSSFRTVNLGPVDITDNVVLFAKDKDELSYTQQYAKKSRVDLDHFSRFIINKQNAPEDWRFKSIKHQIVEDLLGEAVSHATEGIKILRQKHKNQDIDSLVTQKCEEFAIRHADIVFETKTLQKPSPWLRAFIEQSMKLDHVIAVPREKLDTLYLYKGRQVYFLGKNVQVIDDVRTLVEPISNIWMDIDTNNLRHEGDVEFSEGKKPLKLVERIVSMTNEAAGEWIIDYFAGSGSTGHAVINLNRRNPQHLGKYILVEMGEYFDDVLLQRIKKAIYSRDWSDGKPVSRTGSSHLLKYIRLESYEDALNNLEMQQSELQIRLLADEPELREDYMLRYMLDIESRGSASLLNIAAFAHPFDYTLKIAAGSVGEARDTAIDLVETFNYLLGLRVRQIDTIRDVVTVQGLSPEGQRVLIIWRDVEKLPNDELDKFFQKQGYTARDQEFDLIYVNGDNNLENLRRDDETWKVRLTEQEFQRLMFDVRDV